MCYILTPTNFIIHDTNVLPLAKSVSNLCNEVSDHYWICGVPNLEFQIFYEPRAQVDPGNGKNPRATLSRAVSLEYKPHQLLPWLKLLVLPSRLRNLEEGTDRNCVVFLHPCQHRWLYWIVLYKNISHLWSIYSVLHTVLSMRIIVFCVCFFNPHIDLTKEVLCPLQRWAEWNPECFTG